MTVCTDSVFEVDSRLFLRHLTYSLCWLRCLQFDEAASEGILRKVSSTSLCSITVGMQLFVGSRYLNVIRETYLCASAQPADNSKLRSVVGHEFLFTPLEEGAQVLYGLGTIATLLHVVLLDYIFSSCMSTKVWNMNLGGLPTLQPVSVADG